jgi:hypothetical protein
MALRLIEMELQERTAGKSASFSRSTRSSNTGRSDCRTGKCWCGFCRTRTPRLPNRFLQRKNVAWLTPSLRQISSTGVPPSAWRSAIGFGEQTPRRDSGPGAPIRRKLVVRGIALHLLYVRPACAANPLLGFVEHGVCEIDSDDPPPAPHRHLEQREVEPRAAADRDHRVALAQGECADGVLPVAPDAESDQSIELDGQVVSPRPLAVEVASCVPTQDHDLPSASAPDGRTRASTQLRPRSSPPGRRRKTASVAMPAAQEEEASRYGRSVIISGCTSR